MDPIFCHTALATSIVHVLQRYGEVPVTFLSRITGRRSPEIVDTLDALQKRQVVEIHNGRVQLSEKAGVSTRA